MPTWRPSWCVVRDRRCSSLSGYTQKKCYCTVLRHIFFFLLVKLSFKLTNIICVIRGSIQTGLKDNLSLPIDFNTYFFRNKVPWRTPGRGGTSNLYLFYIKNLLELFIMPSHKNTHTLKTFVELQNEIVVYRAISRTGKIHNNCYSWLLYVCNCWKCAEPANLSKKCAFHFLVLGTFCLYLTTFEKPQFLNHLFVFACLY